MGTMAKYFGITASLTTTNYGTTTTPIEVRENSKPLLLSVIVINFETG